MGLDIWFREDIRNALLAANEASSATADVAQGVDNVDALKHFRQGYRAALVTVALAFGLSPTIIDGGRLDGEMAKGEVGNVLKIPEWAEVGDEG